MFKIISFFFLSFCVSASSIAAIDAHEFEAELDRERYQTFIQELRCPKCQNQNLSDSNSQIAIDLRNEVARMINEGYNDQEIIDFMVTRYGDFVLYRPPMQSNTMVLWVAPAVMFGLGFSVFAFILFRRSRQLSKDDPHPEP